MNISYNNEFDILLDITMNWHNINIKYNVIFFEIEVYKIRFINIL